MPRFKYTVISTDGKKLNGTIDSPDEKTARSNLNDLGFSIISINEIEETASTKEEGTILYEFEAFDQKGKKVVGTIPATDPYAAFKRLQLEYEFTVISISKAAASSYEKLQEKQQGVAEFQQRLQKELKQEKRLAETGGESVEAVDPQKEEAEHLKSQIDFVLKKVTELLNKYGDEIPADKRKEVNNQVNKLLRIKNSTNLSYIRSTAAELLKLVQKQESIMFTKDNDLERSKLKFEILKMSNEIHKSKVKGSWREETTKNLELWLNNSPTDSPGLILKYRIKLAKWLLSIIKESAEIRELKNKYNIINSQIKDYMKMYVKESNPNIKLQIKENIGGLLDKRKKTKLAITTQQKAEREKQLAGLPENFFTSFIDEIYTFTGWLLAFYLTYYFISIYISTKDFGLSEIPNSFRVYESSFFKYILVILFLAHSSISVKINFFRHSLTANLVIFPTLLITIMLIMFNL